MKYSIFLWIFLLGCLSACKDDDNEGFDVPVEFAALSFDAVPGGAVMRYKLSDNTDIFGVRVRYTDAFGERLYKDGSYLSDTLLLSGFTEACADVPVQISLFNSSLKESRVIEKTFSTKAAATVALFDNLTVNPFWGGFNVTYFSPEIVSGMIHVFYVGTNPLTHEPDSILMGSYSISEGGDTLNFEMQQTMDFVDVVVRTDDYAGHRVKLQVYEKIPRLTMTTLPPADFDFDFTGDVLEDETYGFSKKYLFDGKKKGDDRRKNIMNGERYKYSTFVAGPQAFNERFIVDLRSPQIPAAINLYAFQKFDGYYPSQESAHPFPSEVWSGYYGSRLPSKVKVYGTNDPNPRNIDLSSCAILCKFEDNPDFSTGYRESWCAYSDCVSGRGDVEYQTVTDDVFNAADPIVLNLLCNYTGTAYRYLIFVVEDTYDGNRWGGQEENPFEYVTFDELEVCVKAE